MGDYEPRPEVRKSTVSIEFGDYKQPEFINKAEEAKQILKKLSTEV